MFYFISGDRNNKIYILVNINILNIKVSLFLFNHYMYKINQLKEYFFKFKSKFYLLKSNVNFVLLNNNFKYFNIKLFKNFYRFLNIDEPYKYIFAYNLGKPYSGVIKLCWSSEFIKMVCSDKSKIVK